MPTNRKQQLCIKPTGFLVGVGFGVILILETFCRNSLLTFHLNFVLQIHFFRFLDYFTGTACLRFYKEKKHI